jgi:predicted CXXCH cytochrome family protein
MSLPRDPDRHRRGRAFRRAAPWLACLCAAALGLSGLLSLGCSIEKNYKVLSFFFDGVPDPNAPMKPTRPGGTVDIEQSPTYSAHKPWKEERCEECHTRTLKMGSRDSEVCLKCHAAKMTEHERMHGPVAVGACLWCHNPHNSAYPHLLKGPAREVCAQCHSASMLSAEKAPAHAQENRSCLECHHGHGGDQRFFLREAGEGK